MRCVCCIKGTTAPDATVATYGFEDKHFVLNAGAFEYVELDFRRKAGF